MKSLLVAAGLGCLLYSAFARANACTTSSHGIAFQGEAFQTECERTAVTIDAECAANVRCGEPLPYPSGQAVCRALSDGVSFTRRGPAEKIADLANAAVMECEQSPRANILDCVASARCEDGS